ncbi:MAG: DUF2490 domain-containing protein [Phycisphaerae bacterium]|nr:DUF2490 domain-containing protein [Phycisphaerae bacterium]
MKRLCFVLLGLLLLSTAQGREDLQYLSSWSADHQINDKSFFSLYGECYSKNDMSDDYVYDGFITYGRIIEKGFGMLVQGYFESVEAGNGLWRNTRSVVLGPTYKASPGEGWTVKGQIRFFYQLDPSARFDYYRPRLTVIKDYGPFKLSLSDEMRVDLTNTRETDFFRNRVFLTALKDINRHFTLGLGYVRQSDKISGDWHSFNAIQTLVTWHF